MGCSSCREIMNLPFWDEGLVEESFDVPPAWVGALDGFGALDGDEIALLDGISLGEDPLWAGALGDLDGFCSFMRTVAPTLSVLVATQGPSACSSIFTDKTDIRNCKNAVRAAGTGATIATALIRAAGCSGGSTGTSPPPGPSPEERRLAAERARLELERLKAKERRKNMLLVGGGAVVLGVAALIAFR